MNSQPREHTSRLGFIGGGKLAGSVIMGLVGAGFCPARSIIVAEPNEQTRGSLANEVGIGVTAQNSEVASAADVLFVGVKPTVVLPVLRDLPDGGEGKLIISLAAGVRIEAMQSVSKGRVMRAMTNTPSAICRAATAIVRGPQTTEADVEIARKIFHAIGVVVEVTENQIDAVTALSGSGPAFVYSVIEALGKGGEAMGLDEEAALTLATQTVLGAAELAGATKKSPEELRQMVVTPGGTTAAGLAAMEKHGVTRGLIAAVEAATKRGQEMAKENK